MERKDLIVEGWNDYELLDSGDGMKLERYGDVVVSRPETQALWKPQHSLAWEKVQATFEWGNDKGAWKTKSGVPESWELSWHDTKFVARLTSFKHTGIFPEQAANWQWIDECVRKASIAGEKSKVLNLFGYTGIASSVATQAGAFVTHVDASKQSLDWAHENADASGIAQDAVRYMCDDALAFAKREVRRGAKYDGIILDPPAFGRGAKGEVWKIEEQLPELIGVTKELLSEKPRSFYLLNGYAAGYAAQSFAQLVESVFGKVNINFGDLSIKESSSDRLISTGIYTSFIR